MLEKLVDQIHKFRSMRVRQSSRYWSEMQHIPAALYPYWKETARHEFQGIPQDAFFYARAIEGLLTFFDCVRRSDRPCGLPSRAADSVWHAWLRMDKEGLETFCLRRFGRKIAHLEWGDASDRMEASLAATLVQARKLEGLATEESALPKLFQLDRKLRMPRGFDYRVLNDEIWMGPLNSFGDRALDVVYMGLLGVHGLFSQGLITAAAYANYTRAANARLAANRSTTVSCEVGDGCGGGCGGD